MEIGPDSFQPPPQVDSCVVQLRPNGEAGAPEFEAWLGEIVRTAFSARRKTLANALRAYVDAATFTHCGIPSTARAEELSVADFVQLAQAAARNRSDVTHNSCG